MDTPPFTDLGLPAHLLEAVEALGYEQPSPIQAAAIPPAMQGRDLIGLSETGSGKTAAFTLPALAKIDIAKRVPQVLILCPTRELAVQVCEEVHRLGSKLPGLSAIPVYGGAPIDRQLRFLHKGVHVIVGTPGRLLDHLRRKSFDPSNIKLAILDEADRMLDMGFREDMEDILGALHKEHQTLFFSATMNRGVEGLIKKFGNDPETVSIKRKTLTVEAVEQRYYEVRHRSKLEVLSRIIDLEQPRLALVFCNTKRVVDECTEALVGRGYAADRLHGDISQQLRERTLRRFRDGSIELLIATDVAARGLDIDDIDIVFNYEIPQDPEDYVHRIGRTGRAGRAGRAISFIFGRDIYRLQAIERYIRQQIAHTRIPSQEDVEGRRADQLFETLKETLESGGYNPHGAYIERLLDQGHAATDIAGALLSLLRGATGREAERIVEDNPDHHKTERRERRPDHGDRRDNKGGKKERFERKDRGERDRGERDRGDRGGGTPEQGMTRLFLSLGNSHGVAPGEIAGMLYREAGLPDGSIGRISIFPRHTLIDVRADLADGVLEATRSSKLRGRPFRLAHDRK
jgi:ATP-dependent RNA helicase DeaD